MSRGPVTWHRVRQEHRLARALTCKQLEEDVLLRLSAAAAPANGSWNNVKTWRWRHASIDACWHAACVAPIGGSRAVVATCPGIPKPLLIATTMCCEKQYHDPFLVARVRSVWCCVGSHFPSSSGPPCSSTVSGRSRGAEGWKRHGMASSIPTHMERIAKRKSERSVTS